jgi:outer membrane protein OmpA-like peptidoglycan-associated protein
MSEFRRHVPFGTLGFAIAISVLASPAAAQTPGSVRVVNDPAPILRWFRAPIRDVLLEVQPGTTLEVLDQERGWFWVIMPPDAHGTRKAGWIQARNVEVVERAAALTPKPGQLSNPASLAGASAQASGAPTAVTITEDKVTITAQEVAASARTNAPAARKEYKFEEVHFDRDRYALRSEEMDILRAAVAALKTDPLLVVNIEGYTCSLGTAAYNMALGTRRANAVKDYLMGEGIAASRLHTVSFGEEHATHDNSHEETRRLNRRVALVPNAQP